MPQTGRIPKDKVAATTARKEVKEAARRAVRSARPPTLHPSARLKDRLKTAGYEEGAGLLKPGAAPRPGPAGGGEREGPRPEGLLGDLWAWMTGGPRGQPEGGGAREPAKDPAVQPDPKSEHVSDPTYGKVQGKPFIKEEDDPDEVAMDDVSQGRLGDCYFVASLAAIADKNPDAIRRMIKDNGDGTYTVKFHEGGEVVVDDQFPLQGGRVAYAGPGDQDAKDGKELWVMLIEKAWAKLKGGYEQIRGSKVRMESEDAMEAMTGNKTTTVYTSSKDDATLLELLAKAADKGLPMTAGVYTKDRFDQETLDKMSAQGVYPNHAYAVVSVDRAKGTVELYNPWGKETKRPVLEMGEFKKYYQSVHINAK